MTARPFARCLLLLAAWPALARAADANPPPASRPRTLDSPGPSEPPSTPFAPAAADASGTPASSRSQRSTGVLVLLGLGGGMFSAGAGGHDNSRHFSGATFSTDLLLGGHLGPRFEGGVTFSHDEVLELAVTDSDPNVPTPDVSDVGFALNTFGVFGDWMLPVRRPELHARVFAGMTWLSVSGPGNADRSNPTGPGFGAAFSGEQALGTHVTLGLAARLTFAPLTVREQARDATNVPTLAPALLATLRYD